MREIESWLSDEELKALYSYSYWNSIDEEKKKFWWIEDGKYEKCLNYLKSSKLLDEYQMSERFVRNFSGDNLVIADLAAGIGWTSVLLSKLNNVKEVHALEMSKHRISFLFEQSLKMFSGEEDKIFRYIGNFYDLKFENESIDIIYMSQAFHHADKPLELLHECDRVLKKNGRIILVGEHYIGACRLIIRFLVTLFKRKKITFDFRELYPPDPDSGDHYYRPSDYLSMFNSLGYNMESHRVGYRNAIIVADKGKIYA